MNNLDLLGAILNAGGYPSEQQLQWLRKAIAKNQHGLPLAAAFEINARSRSERRNELLRNYAQALESSGDWERARIILDQLNRLLSGLKCSPLVEEANSIKPIPQSQRHVYRIITSSTDKTYYGNVSKDLKK